MHTQVGKLLTFEIVHCYTCNFFQFEQELAQLDGSVTNVSVAEGGKLGDGPSEPRPGAMAASVEQEEEGTGVLCSAKGMPLCCSVLHSQSAGLILPVL